jgi:polysaccharide biosynthesis/export protein
MNTLSPKLKRYSLFRPYGWWPIIFLLISVSACAGPSRPPSPEQMVSQVQIEAKKNKFQDQLLTQIGRATLTGYHDYKVGPEDLLEISFYGQEDVSGDVRVNGQGKISMALVGEVQVAGLSPREIENRLFQLYKEGQFFTNPQIKVLVKEYRHQRVVVSGAIAKPGAYEMIGPRTLLEIIGQAGGLSERASDVIHVIRSQSAPERAKALKVAAVEPFSPGAETIVIDLRRLLMDGAMELNLPIKNGDVIHAPFAQNAYVLGAVRKPGNVPVKERLTVAQAIALAGGLDPMLASNNVTVVRFDDNGQRIDLKYNLKQMIQGSDSEALVKQNDIIFVAESGIRRALYDFKNLFPGQFSAIPMAF